MREIVRDALGDHVEIAGINEEEGTLFFKLRSDDWSRVIGFGILERWWAIIPRDRKIEILQERVADLLNE